jgi:hypothetical protein
MIRTQMGILCVNKSQEKNENKRLTVHLRRNNHILKRDYCLMYSDLTTSSLTSKGYLQDNTLQSTNLKLTNFLEMR